MRGPVRVSRLSSSRAIEALCLVAVLVVSGAASEVYFATPRATGGNARLTAFGDSCPITTLLNESRTYHPAVSRTQASADANNSATYHNEMNALGPSVLVRWAGVGSTASSNQTTCTTTEGSYLVAYALNFTAQSNNTTTYMKSGQFSILINATTGAVQNSSVVRFPDYTTRYATTNWAGQSVTACEQCTIWGSLTEYTGFHISQSAGNCGATWYWSGTCLVSYWGGITQQSNGASGIVQSGIQASVFCYYIWFVGYSCSNSFEGWIQFYPVTWVIYDPWMSVHPTDLMVPYNYESGGWFYSVLWDASNGQTFWGATPAYMSSINWGQFQAENSKSLSGSTYALPSYSAFWYNPVEVWGDPADVVPYSSPWTAIYTTGTMQYNAGACSGWGLSCFQN